MDPGLIKSTSGLGVGEAAFVQESQQMPSFPLAEKNISC